MSYSLLVRKKAEYHLEEAFDWYEKKRIHLGSEFFLSVEAIFNTIQENPHLFPIRHKNIRCALIPRFPYGVFYLVDENKVIVIAIFHLSRNPKLWRD